MMQLNNAYNRDDFLKFLEDTFLTDFDKDIRPVSTQGFSSIQKAYSLGKSKNLDLQVFEFSFEGSPNKRVTLTKDAFHVMRSHAIFRALAIFHSPESDDWRLSLMTATPERTEKGKISLSYSNPKRLSFFLGPNAKVNTPTKFILKNDRARDFEDLKSRFSIEVVNKEFYNEISQKYIQLVGGTLGTGRNEKTYKPLLKLPSLMDYSQTSLEFGVRLIGRIIFCWFLREKKSSSGKSLMPKELLSYEAIDKNPDYYHRVLEPIFFEVLNKPVKLRVDDFSGEIFSLIPYLNGGLFSPHEDDYYRRSDRDLQSQFHNILKIPDTWFKELFEILETYNFTIDENTTFDEELSIDPEMLGRIFENLLAEINPETGESARKSTGSYYTPRVIVDYMVDESLLLYLKNQTQINEEKLRAVISYDLNDDDENLLKDEEKEQIIDALGRVKILDPACGSGAFPMGALQKIVFILQQVDPEGQLWFKKQIKNTSPEIKKVIEREFVHKNFDYIRKLGIIRENIYGVDIQPIATEISRLRCFLTLVVDQKVDESLENRGIEPLPNLDFKFVTANSLIGLPKVTANIVQDGLFEDRTNIGQLKEVRARYFGAGVLEREQLKTEFEQIQKRMFKHMLDMKLTSDLTHQLSNWEPFSHKSAEWFDPDWMFGIKEGFDIVIANPPYISFYSRESHLDKYRELLKYLVKNYQITQNYRDRRLNTVMFFIENACRRIKSNGIFSFIIDANFLEKPFRSIRKFLIENNFDLTISKRVSVFENVTSDQMLICGKSDIKSSDIKIIEPILDRNFYYFGSMTTGDFTVDYVNLTNSTFTVKGCTILGKMAFISTGVQIGIGGSRKYHNKAIEDLFYSETKLPNWFKNISLKSNDFYRYSNLKIKNYINLDSKLAYEINKNVAKCNIAVSKVEPFINRKKIVVRQSSPSIIAALASEDQISEYSGFMLYPITDMSIECLLGILNSSFITYYAKANKLILSGEKKQPQIRLSELRKVPIPKVSKAEELNMASLVGKILAIMNNDEHIKNPNKQAQIKEYEKQIDHLVYKLYGLTLEEIAIVEGGQNG